MSTKTSKSSKKNRTHGKPAGDDWEFTNLILSSKSARTIMLWGPPGTGKTYAAQNLGLNGRDVFSVTLTPDTPASELRGFWSPKGQEFVFQEGVFIDAMRRGARVVINEISYASHDVIAILHPILESKETSQLTLPSLETVRPAEGFQVVVTDNQPLDQLPEALRDRFKSVLHVDRPHPSALARLPEDLREAALRTFDLDADRAVSIRGWLSVAEFEAEFDRPTALRAAFGRERGEQLARALELGAA